MCAPSVGHLVPALVRAKQAIRSIAGRPAHGAGKRSHGVAFGGTRGARAPKEFALGQRSATQARAGDTGRAEVITREQLTSGNRFAILNRISMAKKPETRQKRIDQFIVMLNEKKTIY